MSVLIKGMEMPPSCRYCEFRHMSLTQNAFCTAAQETIDYMAERTKRLDNCPLIELPPHGRLIDADEISKHKYATIPPYRKEYSDGKPKSEDEVIAFKFGWNDAIDAIVANAPTIIEAEEEGEA